MKTKILAFFLVFSSFLLPLNTLDAAKTAPAESRYFVKSTAKLWKNSFNARNVFDNGFTANLTDWQLRTARIFKIEVEPVAKFYVSPSVQEIVLSGTPADAKSRAVPENQIPWDRSAVYNATDAVPRGGEGITVAVLDTGIIKTHSDLIERIEDCKDFTAPKAGPVNGKCDDRNGHGTHVAGIIAADAGEDELGIYGVAPEADLFAYKVCDQDGICWADDVAVAMHAAVDNGAHIINLSFGGDTYSPLLNEAINYAGDREVFIAVAAGNDGPYTGSIDYPALNTRVISVGALDEELNIPDWSSRGTNSETDPDAFNEKDLQFAAPGVNIESTWKDGYAILSGTSMAAPHVSALAALLWDKDAEHPAQAVRDFLASHTIDIGDTGEDDDSGYGFPVLSE